MIECMGFARPWIDMIMWCISSVSYSININGVMGTTFKPSRGLRQDDPLSQFLFLICSEDLSILMEESIKQGLLKGTQISMGGPHITHLLFADDYLLFGEANESDVQTLKWVLKEYEECSGQSINLEKSLVLFSTNVGERVRHVVSGALGVCYSNDPDRYLGLPSMVGCNKKFAFQSLKDRLRHKIDSWSVKFLSQGGSEVFVKSVLHSILMYTMMCFLLPRSFCNELESIISKFWWQKGHNRKGIH